MELFGYFRSSASYRVRIALNLKQLDYKSTPVNLLKNEQQSEAYLEKNPQGLVPALATEEGTLNQSLAILEWLEEHHPNPALIPGDSAHKAMIRAAAYTIACDIQPIQNLRVLKYLTTEFGADEAAKEKWIQHWISLGFEAFEKRIEGNSFCFGDTPTIADVCLIPQVYNAKRFNLEMSAYPKIQTVIENCEKLRAFTDAHPDNQ